MFQTGTLWIAYCEIMWIVSQCSFWTAESIVREAFPPYLIIAGFTFTCIQLGTLKLFSIGAYKKWYQNYFSIGVFPYSRNSNVSISIHRGLHDRCMLPDFHVPFLFSDTFILLHCNRFDFDSNWKENVVFKESLCFWTVFLYLNFHFLKGSWDKVQYIRVLQWKFPIIYSYNCKRSKNSELQITGNLKIRMKSFGWVKKKSLKN